MSGKGQGALMLVTIDADLYRLIQFGQQGPFSDSFSDAYHRVVPSPPPPPYGWVDKATRPDHPPYSKLWGRYQYPKTPMGIFLWKTGEVRVTDNWIDDDLLTADETILGGHHWFTPDDSWQAAVMTAAGYPLIRYEGPVV